MRRIYWKNAAPARRVFPARALGFAARMEKALEGDYMRRYGNIRIMLVGLLATCLLNSSEAQTVYKYVDKNGTIVITDRPEQIPSEKAKEAEKREMPVSTEPLRLPSRS